MKERIHKLLSRFPRSLAFIGMIAVASGLAASVVHKESAGSSLAIAEKGPQCGVPQSSVAESPATQEKTHFVSCGGFF